MRTLIIFDLDGTLAHTAPDLIATLNRVTQPHGVEPASISQVGQIVGHGAKAMIARAFELSGASLLPQLHDQLFAEFLEDYSENIDNQTKLFDGASTAIESLGGAGFTMAVCTNKMHAMATRLLDKLEVAESFAAVTGGDSFEFRKPDARHLIETARLSNKTIGDAIMVGDSATDINAARNAGIPSIAVTFGYSDVSVQELGADRIIGHFDELNQAVSDIR